MCAASTSLPSLQSPFGVLYRHFSDFLPERKAYLPIKRKSGTNIWTHIREQTLGKYSHQIYIYLEINPEANIYAHKQHNIRKEIASPFGFYFSVHAAQKHTHKYGNKLSAEMPVFMLC